MRTSSFFDALPTFLDENGKPLVGRVEIFLNDSAEYAQTYIDPEGTKTAANPMRTNGMGKFQNQVFLPFPDEDEIVYRIVVSKFLGENYSDMDEYWDDPEMWKAMYEFKLVLRSDGNVGNMAVDSMDSLPGADTSFGIVIVKGFYAAGDCPARAFVYTKEAIFPTDGCTSVKSKDGGYWTWFPGPFVDSGCFGIMPYKDEASVASAFASLQKFTTSTTTSKVIKHVSFRSGTYVINSDVSLLCKVDFEPHSKLMATSANCVFQAMEIKAWTGFVVKSTGTSVPKITLKVLSGKFHLDWYEDGYGEISSFGTPDTIIVDADADVSVASFKDIKFEGTFGEHRIKLTGGTVSFLRCGFENGPVLSDTDSTLTFAHCGRVVASDVFPNGIKASDINRSTSKFVIDETVTMDEDLSATDSNVEISGGALFTDSSGELGTLSIDFSMVVPGMIDCETKFSGTDEIDTRWFKEGTRRSSLVINSAISSEISRIELHGETLYFSPNVTNAFRLRNGNVAGTSSSSELLLDNVSNDGDFAFNGDVLKINRSTVAFKSATMKTATFDRSSVSFESLETTKEFASFDSAVTATAISVSGDSFSVHGGSVYGDGRVTATNVAVEDAIVNVPIDSENVSILSGTYVSEKTSGQKLIMGSSSTDMETIHDNGNESQVRKTVNFTDGFMGRTGTETYRFYDVNAPMRINGGAYSVAPDGNTKFDVFSMVPAMAQIFSINNLGVSLADSVGTNRQCSYRIGSSGSQTTIKFMAYGLVGASRPKPGQLLVLVPNYSDENINVVFYRSKRFPKYTDLDLSSKYGHVDDLPKPKDPTLKGVQNDGPVLLICLGIGTVDSKEVPVFYNLNGTDLSDFGG